jgi:uncharacterized protein YjbI with pentapeptide repeats
LNCFLALVDGIVDCPIEHWAAIADKDVALGTVKQVERKKLSKLDLLKRVDAHERFVKRMSGGARMAIHFAQIPGNEFVGKALAEAEFVGADLTECDFTGANLNRANFFGANLSYAIFVGADLSRADLRGCILKGAVLEGANLTRADIRDGFIVTANETGDLDYSVMTTHKANMDDAKFAGANLGEARLARKAAQRTDMTNCNLRGANLAGADLSNANMSGVVLAGADLTDTNMSGCKLTGAVLVGAQMSGANLDGADLCASYFIMAQMEKCDMSRAILPRSLADIGISFGDIVVTHNDWLRTGGGQGKQATFDGVDLGQIEWPGITLAAAKMIRVTLVGAKFPSGRFDMSTFEGSMLAEIDMSSASLRGANLDKCTLDGANFRDADFSPLPLAGMQGTKWPARLRGCRAQKADFRGADLSGADLTEASLRDVDFRGANLSGAKLVDCDLAGADLRETAMTDADLRGAMGVR